MFGAEITFDQTYDIVLMLGAVLAVAGGFYQWAWKPYVRADEERAQRIANQAAATAVAPLDEKLDRLNDSITTIKSEVQTNGGKSLKDVVLKTRERQIVLEAKFDQHMQEAHE